MAFELNYPEQVRSVADAIQWAAVMLEREELWYGHGTDNAVDEAAWLVLHLCGIDYPVESEAYARPIDEPTMKQIVALLGQRINQRQPLPYLLKEAWFAGLKFAVDERVLIPRSPFAELIEGGFEPWLSGRQPERILEIGTGSGCIAIACALAFPEAHVVATDISPEALAVARSNVERYKLEDRLMLLEADLLDGVEGCFDLIVTNPPYVPVEEVNSLPEEYNHEPVLALASGNDGMDCARGILRDSFTHMHEHSLLFIEVGAFSEELEAACPDIPFMWLELEHGGEGIAMITEQDLKVTT
ncbi:MAG: 50S ribosomal protein L3 N(5)-glutamine methyltransferase [Gammaproteobacteria bacterium]|nr:50S ribosomal protein L3 N(5)-glutamine methyltransferase [Gammaproteobacteria bacterium]